MRSSRRAPARLTVLAAVVAAAATLGTSDARAAATQPMTFYGVPVSTNAALTIVARANGTSYTVTRLDTNVKVGSGTIDALGFTTVAVPNAVPFRVDTGNVAYVHLGYSGGGFGGALVFPTDDGTTRIGKSFILYRPVAPATGKGQLYVAAHQSGAYTVAVTDKSSMVLATNPVMAGGQVWLEPTVNSQPVIKAGVVSQVFSGGNISVALRTGHSYKGFPVGDGVLQSCNNDVGRKFIVGVRNVASTGNIIAFNYSAQIATINFVPTAGGGSIPFTVPPGQSAFTTGGVFEDFYSVTSNQDVAVWAGDTSSLIAADVDDMGDDIESHVGQGGTRFVLRSQNFASSVFAGENGTAVTVNGGAPTMLNKDGVLTVPAHTSFTLTATHPVVVQTQGGNAPTDWGAFLRPIPRTDSDDDGFPDTQEGPGCLSVAPDTDADGVPDFLDLDSDADCVPDAKEVSNAARLDPKLPAGPHCTAPATPVCDMKKKACRGCAKDAECGGQTPACQSSGACGQCSMTNSSMCTGATPVCDTGKGTCRGCMSDGDCGGMTPACQPDGSCNQCSKTNSSQCSGTTAICNAPTGVCSVCSAADASACAASADGHACQSGAMGMAFCGCMSDADCGAATSARVCDAASHKCKDGCSPATGRNGCPAGQFCSSNDLTGMKTGLCTTTCNFDADCAGMTGMTLCLVGQDGGASSCVACRADTDCTVSPALSCTSDTHACVECTMSKTCKPDGSGGMCLGSGKCGCVTDADCGSATSGRICEAAAMTCMSGCRGAGGNGCPSGQACSSTDMTAGSCAAAADLAGMSSADVGVLDDAGITDDAATMSADLAAGGGGKGGCSCALAGRSLPAGTPLTGAALIVLALLAARRRRR